MPDIEKRLKYYNGQFLQEQDFTAEQEYNLDRLRRHNRLLHVPGIAAGLEVTAAVGATSATVAAGTAIDNEGRQIVLATPRNVAFASLTNQWVLVVISFHDEPSDDATVGDAGKTRYLERPDVGVIPEAGAPAADVRIRLARLRIAANGTIAEHDTTARTPAGARLRPEETVERLRLSRQGVSSNLWPVLSSGAASRADLAGSLSVTGDILVTGNVDGRDVSADGALNDTHRGRTDNPHGVTAAQVGAPASVATVANPGGNIAVTGASGITVAGNNTTKTITVTGGSPVSIDGVSNAGGNIDFVGQNGISITPDNTGKLIAFSTSPGALGALPAGDYLKRSMTSVWFNQGHADLATTPVTVGFQPKHVWAAGRTWCYLSNGYQGGTVSGFARIDGGGSVEQYGFGPYVYRFNSAPYLSGYGMSTSGAVSYTYFYDGITGNWISAWLELTEVTTTGFKIKLHRSSSAVAPDFYIEVYLSCIG
jgi:hypothetical protein